MSILVDFSNVVISNILSEYTYKKHRGIDDFTISEDLIRHMVFNEFRYIMKNYKQTYGKLVVCIDARNSWRKEIFPHYKHKRKAQKEKSDLDWTEVYGILNTIKNEIRTFTHYRVIEADKAEGDDTIAVLAEYLSNTEDILIVSNDKDFINILSPKISVYRRSMEELYQFSGVKDTGTANLKKFW